MKTMLVTALALSVILSMTAVAQYEPKAPAQTDQAAQAPPKSIEGTIKAEGDKITFVADKDQKSWAVEKPRGAQGPRGTPCQGESPCHRRQRFHSRYGSQDDRGQEGRRNEKRGNEIVDRFSCA